MFSSTHLKETSRLREGRKQWQKTEWKYNWIHLPIERREKTQRKYNWILLGLSRWVLSYTSCTLKNSWQRNYFLAGYVSALTPLTLGASVRWILALILLFDNLVFKELVRFSTSLFPVWTGPHFGQTWAEKAPGVQQKSPVLSSIVLFSHHLWSIPPSFAGSEVWYCFIWSKQKLRNLNNIIAHFPVTKTSEMIHAVHT